MEVTAQGQCLHARNPEPRNFHSESLHGHFLGGVGATPDLPGVKALPCLGVGLGVLGKWWNTSPPLSDARMEMGADFQQV